VPQGSVVWLAQMVAVMPSIAGDQARIRTGRMWPWCRNDTAATAVELKPHGAAFVPLEALPAGRGRAGPAGSVSAGLRECGVRQAGRPPAVVFHPVRDRVPGVGGLVAGPAEPLVVAVTALMMMAWRSCQAIEVSQER